MADITMIIDPPVGPYHSAEAIQGWIDELREMAEAPEVTEAIEQAEEWLAHASGE